MTSVQHVSPKEQSDLTLEEATKKYWISLSKNKSEMVVSCGGVADLKALFQLVINTIMADRATRKLTLRYCRDLDATAILLNEILPSCLSLESLVLDGVNLSRACLVPIKDRIERKQLRELAIFRHWIDCDLGMLLAEALNTEGGLQVLQLEMAHIGDVVAESLLENGIYLRELNLSNNNLSPSISGAVLHLLQTGRLESLRLAYNSLLGGQEGGSETVAAAVAASTTLRVLDLRGVKQTAFLPIFDAVGNSPSMEDLLLSGSGIDDKDIPSLCKAIRASKQLKRLDLSRNNIRTKGYMQLVSTLSHNSTLEYLDIHGNDIYLAGGSSLERLLENNTGLQELVLTTPRSPKSGVVILEASECEAAFRALKVNKTLRVLHMNKALIGAKGVHLLSEVLRVNPTLAELHMEDVQYPNWTGVVEALKDNSSLEKFAVRNMDDEQKKVVDCYTRLHRLGSKLVKENCVNLGVIPHALTNKQCDLDLTYFLLRGIPSLLQNRESAVPPSDID